MAGSNCTSGSSSPRSAAGIRRPRSSWRTSGSARSWARTANRSKRAPAKPWLAELLDEAEERAFKVVTEKSPELPEAERREIARVVGIGAVKYADLLPNRQSDYVFSWDKMLALNGNTAPYLQYAYARIRSIFRKGGRTGVATVAAPRVARRRPGSSAPEEIALARHLLNFGLVLEAVAEEYRPNFLCNYLYELAGHFTRFYENCPVLKSEADTARQPPGAVRSDGAGLEAGLGRAGIELADVTARSNHGRLLGNRCNLSGPGP